MVFVVVVVVFKQQKIWLCLPVMYRFVPALLKSPPFLCVLKRNLNQVNIKHPEDLVSSM